MSLQKPPVQAEQLLTTLLEQIHATLKETLKQQNDRIARLEAQPDRAMQSLAHSSQRKRVLLD